MAPIAQIFIAYLFYRKLSEYPLKDLIKYGLPIAIGSLIIDLSRPKPFLRRVIEKVT